MTDGHYPLEAYSVGFGRLVLLGAVALLWYWLGGRLRPHSPPG